MVVFELSLAYMLGSMYFFTSCEELTHWKRLWCWEGLGAGGERDDRGWDGWMASPTLWTRVWVNSGNCWWIGRPGMLQFMGSQGVGHNWATELKWTELKSSLKYRMSSFFPLNFAYGVNVTEIFQYLADIFLSKYIWFSWRKL